MSDARTLLLELLAVIPNGERVAALFADDGVVELPFLHALGMPTRHQGRTQIRDFYNLVGGSTRTSPSGRRSTTILIETPDQVFAEYMTHAKGYRHWAKHPSSVCRATCCGRRTD